MPLNPVETQMTIGIITDPTINANVKVKSFCIVAPDVGFLIRDIDGHPWLYQFTLSGTDMTPSTSWPLQTKIPNSSDISSMLCKIDSLGFNEVYIAAGNLSTKFKIQSPILNEFYTFSEPQLYEKFLITHTSKVLVGVYFNGTTKIVDFLGTGEYNK